MRRSCSKFWFFSLFLSFLIAFLPFTFAPGAEPIFLPSQGEFISVSGGHSTLEGNPSTITREGGRTELTGQANIAFVLDASASMSFRLPGSGRSKLEVAKEALNKLINRVPPEINGALWIYGHRGNVIENPCEDIEQVFPLGRIDTDAYIQAVRDIQATGYTPIADTLEKVAGQFSESDDQYNSVILISDGKETCGGHPCDLAGSLKESGARITIHVVGYEVDKGARDQLKCIATASGGMYRDASSAGELEEALTEALGRVQAKATARLELISPKEKRLDGKLSLYRPGSDQLVSSSNAWCDLIVEPGTYDLVVETVPNVVYHNVEITGGSSTVIHLTLGGFDLLGVEGEPVTPYQVNVLDRESGDKMDYLLDPSPDPYYIAPGSYDLALYPTISASSPQAIFRDVQIDPSKITILQLGAFDLRGVEDARLRPSVVGFHEPKSDKLIARFSQTDPELYYLAPGPYRVGYGITWTCAYWSGWIEEVLIKPGQTTLVTMGAYVFHDPDGEPVNYAHTVIDSATGEDVGYYCGRSELNYAPPGTYDLKAQYADFSAREVFIKAGEVTIVEVPEE